jgi:hypothetical protein
MSILLIAPNLVEQGAGGGIMGSIIGGAIILTVWLIFGGDSNNY